MIRGKSFNYQGSLKVRVKVYYSVVPSSSLDRGILIICMQLVLELVSLVQLCGIAAPLILRYYQLPSGEDLRIPPARKGVALGTWCVFIDASMVRSAVPLGISCIKLTVASTLVGSISSLSVLLLVCVLPRLVSSSSSESLFCLVLASWSRGFGFFSYTCVGFFSGCLGWWTWGLGVKGSRVCRWFAKHQPLLPTWACSTAHVCLLKRLQWQASFGYNWALKFHTWNVNLTSFWEGGAHGCIGGCHSPRSSVGPFMSICVMYVKCCSLVRYRPYIFSGTLLFNRRSLPAAGNLFYLFLFDFNSGKVVQWLRYWVLSHEILPIVFW